ncbi:MAG: septal ring lytic transglycosylase RlpA family protein [Acidobacteriota bacterium]
MKPHPTGQRDLRSLALLGIAAAALFASGCRHRTAQLPAPQQLPPPAQPAYEPPASAEAPPPAHIPVTPVPPGGIDSEDLEYIHTHRPIATQTGYATWYTAPYKGRRAANGEVFQDYAMTAAHRTLPMGSLVVVTNLETGQSSPMRIADRGPFVRGRIIDLTIASAKATGVYRMGLARVRVDVYETPKPIYSGGRWCVQIGAFHDQRAALHLKKRLERAYPRANVIEFSGEKSFWVRIRPEDDNLRVAQSIARHVHPSEGIAFLTRLD